MKTKTAKIKLTKAQALEMAQKLVESPVFMQIYMGDAIFEDNNREYYNLKMLGNATLRFRGTATSVMNNPRYAKNKQDLKDLISAINKMDKVYAKTMAKLSSHPDNQHNYPAPTNRKPGEYHLMATCKNNKYTNEQVKALAIQGIELGYDVKPEGI